MVFYRRETTEHTKTFNLYPDLEKTVWEFEY